MVLSHGRLWQYQLLSSDEGCPSNSDVEVKVLGALQRLLKALYPVVRIGKDEAGYFAGHGGGTSRNIHFYDD